jgi:hypothetical protein
MGYKRVQEIQVSDRESLAVIQKSKRFFEDVDRCDPFSCIDHLQVMSIEYLNKPVCLANTGAAGISGGRVGMPGVGIIESSKRLHGYPTTPKYICRTGDYLLTITHRNWLYLPIDFIGLCYHTSQADSQIRCEN